MKKAWIFLIVLLSTCVLAFSGGQQGGSAAADAKPVKLVGATMLPEGHVFERGLSYFAELVEKYYDGPVEIDIHHSGDLGQEKDFFEYMMQGVSVDFAVVSPDWMATWDKRVSFLGSPFIWRDLDHWNKGLKAGVFKPIEEELLNKTGVRILGYFGGGTRNLILKKRVETMDDLSTVLMRVPGAPIYIKVFESTGIKPTPLPYLEVYNAIKTGVIDGLENEASSMAQMKFYEVAPFVILSRHTITTRPICFSEKRLETLPPALRQAILKAGAEAAQWARDTESSEDNQFLKKLEDEGKITLVEFDNSEMIKKAYPVIEDFAKELGAEDILAKINSIN